MKKHIFSVVLFLFFINNIEAQSNYYFANYQRQYWREDSTSINIIVANMQNYNLIVRNLQTIFSANNDTVRYGKDDDNIIVISDKLKKTDLQKMVSSISPDSADISFVTYAKKINNRRLWFRNEAYVKLKCNVSDSSYLLPFLSHFSNYTLDYDSEESDYKITCNNESVLLQIANCLYDTQYVHYSTPDFYCEMSLNTIDPYYGDQWALNNIGQEGGEVGVDIKAEKAWEFLQYMWCTVDQLNPIFLAFNSQQAAVFNIHPSTTQDYCNFELPLWIHYHLYYNAYGNTTPLPYANVPKTFTRLTSVPNNSDYPVSWRTIPSGATSEYAAHEEVLLQDGFYAEPGSDFLAHIVPCEPCEEARTTDYTSDMVGAGDDNSADTLAAPKSWQIEATQSDDAALNVYPNPTSDLLHIELSGTEIATVALYDFQGRIIYSPNLSNSPNSPMNMRDIPAGMYVLCVTGADGHAYHQKIVKR